jgi:large subunit ribosomal protein L5
VTPRLKDKYRAEVVPALLEKMAYANVNQVPRVEKIVLNMGIGAAVQDPKQLEVAMNDLAIISGQKPAMIGAKVTLRGDRMWEFMDRLLATALPRIRDFRGISATSFDGRGNYSLGVTEQLIFPEIDYDKVDRVRGMDVTFVTSAKTDEECRALLDEFGFPFKR